MGLSATITDTNHQSFSMEHWRQNIEHWRQNWKDTASTRAATKIIYTMINDKEKDTLFVIRVTKLIIHFYSILLLEGHHYSLLVNVTSYSLLLFVTLCITYSL